MKISEFFRQTGNNFSLFCQKVFGDNPEQYVEEDDLGALAVASDKGAAVGSYNLAELVKALRDAEKSGKEFQKKQERGIKLDSDENGYITTSKAERESAFRDSETMKSIRDKRSDTSAKDLPNSEREQGGEVRSRGR